RSGRCAGASVRRQRGRTGRERALLVQRRGGGFRRTQGIRWLQVDDLLGEPRLEPARGAFDEDPGVRAVPLALDRAPDARRIAPDLRADLAEPPVRVGELRRHLDHAIRKTARASRTVPHVGVTRDDAKRLITSGTDPDRGIRLLDRLWIGDRVPQWL